MAAIIRQTTWIAAHSDIHLNIAFPENHQPKLWSVFTKDLKRNQYRTFTNGNLICTVFKHNDIMKTISTCYCVDNTRSADSRGVSNYECVGIKPLISENGVDVFYLIWTLAILKLLLEQ